MSEDWEQDESLLERWRAGDPEAGAQVVTRHGHAVIRLFRNKVSKGVESLVQETFKRLFEARDRIRNGRALRAFILAIARNVMREHARELAKARAFDPEVDSMAALDPGPSTIAGQRREHRLLGEGLRRLSLNDQIMLELFYWEGLEAPEIAQIEGVSPSAIRTRLGTARKRLAVLIAELGQSARLVASTVDGLDMWADQIRQQLGRGPADS